MYVCFYWLQFFWLLLYSYICRHNIHNLNIFAHRMDYYKGWTIKSAPGSKKALPGANKSAPQSTLFCTMTSMAEASRANRRPPNPLPTLPLPNFPAIIWMMALSWSAALSNCGRFLWWHSEPCSLCPVGLGRNWYFLLQPQKKFSAKQWCDGVKCRHQQLYPPH